MPETQTMRRGFLYAGATLLSSPLFGARRAVAQSQPTTPKELMDQLGAAIVARDVERIAGFYAERAMLLTPQGHIIQGRERIRQTFARNFASGQPPLQLVNARSDGGPQSGVVIWIWAMDIARQGQPPQRRHLRSMLYLKNSASGWHVVADMFQVFTPEQG